MAVPRTIPVTLWIEEDYFFRRMRDIDTMDGIAKHEANLEAAMASQHKKKPHINGADGQAKKATLPQIIQAFLLKEGPQHSKAIKECAEAMGFKSSGVSGILTHLKQNKITEPAGSGFHRLTAKAMKEMGAMRKGAPSADHEPALPLLPAPAVAVGRGGKPAGIPLFMSVMQATDGAVPRSKLLDAFTAAGLAGENTVRNVITRAAKAGLIKYAAKGHYELTPKGKKFNAEEGTEE